MFDRLIAYVEHMAWLITTRRVHERRLSLMKHMRSPELDGLAPLINWARKHAADLPEIISPLIFCVVREVHALPNEARKFFDEVRFTEWLFDPAGRISDPLLDLPKLPIAVLSAVVDARSHLAALDPVSRAMFESLYGRTLALREVHGTHTDETVDACPFCARALYVGWPS